MVSVPGSTRPSRVRVRQGAPDELGGSSLGLEHLFSRRSVPGRLHPWARAGSHRFPGDPSQAFALLQDPGRAGKTSPLAVMPTPPPANPNRRPQRVHNLEGNNYLQHGKDLRAFMDGLKLKDAVVVGWSNGCDDLYGYIRTYPMDNL